MSAPKAEVPVALAIAGSDSGGGAGIQADLKTFAALGVYGTCAVTAVTAQNTLEVREVHEIPASLITEQVEAVLADLPVRAIKVGLLASSEAVAAVSSCLERHPEIPAVCDPVFASTTGRVFLDERGVRAWREKLLPRAALITPNLPEAARLLETTLEEVLADPAGSARALHALGARAVLLKGGHAAGPRAEDHFFDGARMEVLSAPRHPTRNTHGSGCTLSSALAAFLAQGEELLAAASAAKRFTTSAIEAADKLALGQGPGPLHHFFAIDPIRSQRF